MALVLQEECLEELVRQDGLAKKRNFNLLVQENLFSRNSFPR